MIVAPREPAARLRGIAVGLLTATLAVAAHGSAGDALPSGAATAQLVVLAMVIGALASTLARAGELRVLLGLLAGGQVLGHLILGVAGHSHPAAGALPGVAMFSAHLVAIAVGAAMVAANDRLCAAITRTLRAIVRIALPPSATAVQPVLVADQPLQAALVLATSKSRRGPPVSSAH
jgi:hypothetical protein